MKAVITPKYGSPDVLQLQQVTKPVPQDNEVLVKVHAAVVGPSDCAFLKGDPFLIKLLYGLRKPKYAVSGTEFAGEVEAVGRDVKAFKPGDAVFGLSPDNFGAHAEYKCLPEDKPLAIMPARTTYEDAVAICDGALTALTYLRDVAKIKPGQTVLVNGASGAVGSAAVQLARYYGAKTVTGVCSAANVELVRGLGADHVIDYTREDFASSGQTYDIIFDAVGKRTFSDCKRALTPNGVFLSTVPTLATFMAVLRTWKFGSRKAKFTTAGLKQNAGNLHFLKRLVEAGKLRAVIDRCYPLEQIAEAYRYVDKGHKKGNVVIGIA
jgi:NADPH:quinone reductase-like Zn-dependent oxidoreductase